MKHSQTVGILLCLFLLFTTSQPLVIIESRHWVITGWKSAESNFGQPGKFLFYVGLINLLFFALPYIWAKRFNMVFAALILAWSIRNYVVLSSCQMGECPEKQWALYASIFLTAGILLMTFLPKIDVNKK